MNKSIIRVLLFLLSLFIITSVIGCSSKSFSKNNFNVEQFQNAMKAKNYSFKMEDAEKDFLPTARKRMMIGNEAIDIYLFSSNKKMENEAKRIDIDGGGYKNGSESVIVDWKSVPHFYKKGNIIVQYVGQNEKIVSDLESILGKQFAGGK